MVGLSAKAIYRAIERGELAAARVANGSRLLIPATAAETWLVVNAVVPRGVEKPADQLCGGSMDRPLGEALAKLEDAPGED
jgi:excisionase family DNA binding protein